MRLHYVRIEDQMMEPDIAYSASKYVRKCYVSMALFWICFDAWYMHHFWYDMVQCWFALSDILVHQIGVLMIWYYYRNTNEAVILKKPFHCLFVERIAWFLMYMCMNMMETNARFRSIPEFSFYFLTVFSMSSWLSLFCSLL